MKKRQILVTSALPYANGPIHLGHLLEYVQTDVWVRYQRLCGHECCYVCADDAHGSPIMLKAREAGITPEALITSVKRDHVRDFDGFLISFDNYHSTHAEENREFSNLIYRRLKDKGLIFTRKIVQAYDEQAAMFLPDRFIRGECPRCGAADQYGDCCEACGATYTPTELRNPVSVLSGKPPVERESEHYFFALGHFEAMLKSWLDDRRVQPAIRNKLDEWFKAGLRDWDISRDAPYFGFEIPDHRDKYFYVWLDAPIGYMASFKHYCDRTGTDFDHYWKPGSTTELHHFIGKDIAYFHTLFWPAMLEGAGFRKPSSIHCHGFITINREKMSKSRGTFITAETYLKHLPPEYLRYYFAAKLNANIEDIDLSLDDFIQRINSDLIGKVVNIASRSAGFICKNFDGKIRCGPSVNKHELLRSCSETAAKIAADYEKREYATAMNRIMRLADSANRYFDKHQPWKIAQQNARDAKLHEVCSISLIAFAQLIRFLTPVLPQTGKKVEDFMNLRFDRWDTPLFQGDFHRISPFKPLMRRIDRKSVDGMLAASGQSLGKEPEEKPDEKSTFISYDDFKKLDLRVAKVIAAEAVTGADKLLRLKLDDGRGTRSVLAGIKTSYTPESLIGRHVVLLANLTPKKLRFGVSEGMILAAGDDEALLLYPDEGAEPGMKIR